MITPIEVYSMVPKSQETSTVHHGEMNRAAGLQAGVVQSIDKNAEQNANRPVKLKESDDPEYRYDNKDGGNGKGYQPGGKSKDRKDPEKKHTFGYMGPGGIDIRI